MKVLVPLPYDVSSLAHGRNLRVVHLLRELNRHCELHCIAGDDRIAEGARAVLRGVGVSSPADDVGSRPPSRIDGSYLLRRSVEFFGCRQRLMREMVDRSADVDVTLGFDLKSAVYLKAAAEAHGRRLRTVCDLIDDPWLTWKHLPIRERLSRAGIKAGIAVRMIRRELLPTFDTLIAVAPPDAVTLSAATGREVRVIPNGIEVREAISTDAVRELMVVFTGAMDFPPNELAACYLVERVWPHVLRRFSEDLVHAKDHGLGLSGTSLLKLVLVGANPTPKVQRLAERAGVQVTGWVEDVSSWLCRARVAVAPMISGSGMKNKVLEACAAGCPVVSTPLGAAGLPTGEENGILLADSPQRMGEQIARLLADATASHTIGMRGRDMVRDQFSWERCGRKLLEILAPDDRPISSSSTRLAAESDDGVPCVSDSTERSLSDEEALIHAAS